jgi:hypothetical protein
MAAALFLVPFAWICFRFASLWFKFIPVLFEVGLITFGIFLILKRKQTLSKKSKTLLVLFLAFAILTPALLDLKIRADRKALELRAQIFLSQRIPSVLTPNAEGYVGDDYIGTNNDAETHILGHSQSLIERYAKNGRIRWSARIQGQFASTTEQLYFEGSDEIERTNQEVRDYMAERNAILSAEWQMGFWQWVEDTIEMKQKIPEIEEEDFHPAPTTNAIAR